MTFTPIASETILKIWKEENFGSVDCCGSSNVIFGLAQFFLKCRLYFYSKRCTQVEKLSKTHKKVVRKPEDRIHLRSRTMNQVCFLHFVTCFSIYSLVKRDVVRSHGRVELLLPLLQSVFRPLFDVFVIIALCIFYTMVNPHW
ncbi:hypothetical protein RvY_00433 [Ramazzottius varieornatus]|uniref:Uncharacterized protein n=1 Tax=Ramazzottius varieornatus TaxID=947166 RepID=A0A1D1UCR6_RAMVA|nr:hypothetical protein RvY_00433 [Ramazzottius varieornatus]